MAKRTSLQGQWSSRVAFILAVTGSAVGLGNIWKFPYITGYHGGGAFVIVYLLCVFAIGLPTMMAEVLLGRRGRRNPVTTMAILGEEEAGTRNWQVVGYMGIFAGFLILSFYAVVAGWALSYIFKSMSGAFAGASVEVIGATFSAHLANWQALLLWHTLFMLMTVWVVARGVQRGLERAVQILMPALLVLLLILLVYSMMRGDFVAGVRYLFEPDFSRLSVDSVLVALGHAFFTLSVGMGAVMAYGAYLPEGSSIASTSIMVVLADTLIALLAGLVIFPLVFANGLNPGEGPGLIFTTLPVAFGQMQGGVIFGTLFFLLLSFAAWTSAIGLIEPAVAWLTETRNMSRPKATVILGFAIWLFGLVTIFSFNIWSEVDIGRGTPYDNIDFLASNILLPLSGLLIVIFAAWITCRNSSAEELDMGAGLRYNTWRFLARYVAPLAITFIFLNATGILARLGLTGA